MNLHRQLRSRQSGFAYAALLIVVVILLVGAAIAAYLVSKSHPQPATNTAPAATYRVVGNQIQDATGKQYLPLGITVFGLSDPKWQAMEAGDINQINAMSGYWHANTARIQVSPILLNQGTAGYLDAIKHEVSTAEGDGLNVILTAQYERVMGPNGKVTAPDSSTVTFWKTVAPLYANDQRVWFDVFNEPTTDKPYMVWKNGNGQIVGMQELVNVIRAIAPDNLILVESLATPKHFMDLGDNFLDGTNLVYAVHPYFHNTPTSQPQPTSWWQQQWQEDWGYISSTHALLIGEWGEYEGSKSECQTNAPQLVPAFLSYISSLHLGLIGWALTPNVLVRGGDLQTPTSFDPGVSYTCSDSPGHAAQGAGSDIRQYFLGGGSFSS